MNEKEITANIAAFETTGKLLTHPHVPCTCCNGKTTMFGNKPGDNLMKRIDKFGGLRNLLSTFKCRACSKGSEPVKASAPAIKAIDPIKAVAADVAYNSTSAAEAAKQLSAEDCAKIFVAMPNGKLDYWWKHPQHHSNKANGAAVTVTYEDGIKKHYAL